MSRLLLLSNSTNFGEDFFEYPLPEVKDFLADVKQVVFIPFAAVRLSFDRYLQLVSEKLATIGIEVIGLHTVSDKVGAIRDAQAVITGGGNTFHLLKYCYDAGILEAVRERVEGGMPYIGWSAGSVLSGPTIMTTNDMPIVEPRSLKALHLVPFQINAHYTSLVIPGHRGETRDDRLEEFIEVNPHVYVVGLQEGTMLRIEGTSVRLIGEKPLKLFKHGSSHREIAPGEDLSFLLS